MLTRISAPAVEPVSLAEAKSHLAVIGNSDDALLARLISSAVAAFDGPDGKLGRCLIAQEWRFDLSAFPSGGIRMPLPPVISIDAVVYVDAAGATVTLDPSEYSVAGLGSTDHCIIAPVSRWPSATSASVAFTAGFGEADSDVPQDVRNAILAALGSAYAWRESSVMSQGSLTANPEIADAVERWRVRGFGA